MKSKLTPYILIIIVIIGISIITTYNAPTPKTIPTKENSKNSSPIVSTLNRQTQLQNAKLINKEILAWLTIPNTTIDSPIPQGANNEYYLNHTEEGKYDPWGCYFSDHLNNLSSRENLSPNTIIYGHSHFTEDPKEGEFTQLFNYLDIDFVKQNPYIYLSIDGEDLIFQIEAVFFTDTSFDYINPRVNEMPNYYQQINAKNQYVFQNQDLNPSHKLLTLSTCAYRYDIENKGDHRLVILAKLLPQITTQAPPNISYNPNPELPFP